MNRLRNAAAVGFAAMFVLCTQGTTHAKGEVKPMSGNSETTSTIVYVGTYTGEGSEGIYRFRLNHSDGKLHLEGLAAEVPNPSFLALSPDHRFLYCINEMSELDGKKSGGATSFAIDRETLALTQLDQVPSGGLGPCYVSATADGNAVLTANYGSGSVALLPAMDDGGLGDPLSVAQHQGSSVDPKRQGEPHAHCILPDPSGRYAVAVDLGTDEVIAYRLSSESGQMDTSSPVVNKVHPGAGPRHIAFHPNGKMAYTANELDSTVTTFEWSPEHGQLKEVESTATLPADVKVDERNYPSEILVHPNGQFVYVGNRGHNSVAVFKVDQESGKLTLTGTESTRGEYPRGMSIDANGDFMIVGNQNTANLVSYKIDKSTGMPKFASEHKGMDRPVGIVFLQSEGQATQ